MGILICGIVCTSQRTFWMGDLSSKTLTGCVVDELCNSETSFYSPWLCFVIDTTIGIIVCLIVHGQRYCVSE